MVAFRPQPRHRFFEAGHAESEVNVFGIERLVSPHRSLFMHSQMQMLAAAKLKPGAGEIERRARDFAQFENVAVKVFRAFDIARRDQNVMKARCNHMA
jgi:hypothetical protein